MEKLTNQNKRWETVVDFTKIEKDGVNIRKLHNLIKNRRGLSRPSQKNLD